MRDDVKSQLYTLQREFRERTAPYLQVLIDIENVTIHKLLIKDDGTPERIEGYTEEHAKVRQEAQRAMNVIRDEILERGRKIEREGLV